MPQAAVAAAAAAASLTAARLGASPDAIADAVAVAVHNVWRWASPPAQYAAGPVMEADADNLDTWWAEDDIYEAQTDPDEGPADAAAEIQEELGVTVQLMGSVKGEDPKAAAVELQVAAVEQSGISELCVASQPPDALGSSARSSAMHPRRLPRPTFRAALAWIVAAKTFLGTWPPRQRGSSHDRLRMPRIRTEVVY